MQLSFVCTYNGCAALPVQLKRCHEELNKRIYEHDKLVAEGSDKIDITLKVCTYIRTYVRTHVGALQESTYTLRTCAASGSNTRTDDLCSTYLYAIIPCYLSLSFTPMYFHLSLLKSLLPRTSSFVSFPLPPPLVRLSMMQKRSLRVVGSRQTRPGRTCDRRVVGHSVCIHS